jgi:DNA-binding CsgD family transcriptional regulator
MADAPSTVDGLYAAMIEGITSDPPWAEFVDHLRHVFGASHANVIFRGVSSSQVFLASSSNEEVTRFGDLPARYDPSIDPIPYFEMQPFTPYRVEDFIGADPAEDHPFLKDFLRPLGLGTLVICRVKTQSGLQAWLSITRSPSEPFGAQDTDYLSSIARHFASALDAFGRLKEAEDARDAYARVVHARAAGVARLDQNGEVLHVDAKARNWLDEGHIIRLSGQRFSACAPDDEARLSRATSRIISGEADEEFLVLGANGGESLEMLLFRVSEPFEPAWTHAPRIIAYMCMNGRETLPSPQRLRLKFGLTRREAALAILLSRGLTLGQAATDLGISEQTARAYLRQIFQKAGVSRQADLVRQVFGSIGAIA